ncbi:DNA-binding protein [Cocleimonas sp. KMM 6892]|uniref:DNA-binding protein n=1 Tax=unclassified Cocleimonas TaxID=2639732 RepID=UPI002DB985BB|nr:MULTISPECIES: DNA-binding protein [unclassified Cocleimonas]MEB8432585.1 DNA-binding protein [Cocleimonas sp. KMM 6892]MEC4715444.1 DNA-binding protein [Cocleimonas sp. KMM 6895]MEC4744937.1 DNA-binding protein [Cocleimonas sp. KMM 6896]
MKQNKNVIKLLEVTEEPRPIGSEEGKEAFRKLVDYIDNNPTISVFRISLEGIVATDASFPRESVVSVAKHYRGEKWFFLSDLKNRDLIDNWNYAADVKDQPLVIWNDNKFEFIGPKLKDSTQPLISYIYEREKVTTSQVAHDLKISVQNASAKLKKFFNQGFIIRTEESSETGGKEFVYQPIN